MRLKLKARLQPSVQAWGKWAMLPERLQFKGELALAGWATAGLPSQVLYGQGGAFVVVLFFHTANPCSQEGLPALGY